MSDINLNDSVAMGDLVTGIKTENVNLQQIHKAEFHSDRKNCPYCEASGNHTFFACSTLKCSNRYCEYCPQNNDQLCGTCQEFTHAINLWEEHSDSIIKENELLEKQKDSEIKNMYSTSSEMSKINLEDRAKFCHLSTNLQLGAFLILMLFSDIVLNIPHGIEIITYSFFGMVAYNLIRRFYEGFSISKTYILDIALTMAILLISVTFSNLISGIPVIIFISLVAGIFSFRMFNLGLILQGRHNPISEYLPRIDYSAVGFCLCSVFCVLIFYF